jgi:hypothetical protein
VYNPFAISKADGKQPSENDGFVVRARTEEFFNPNSWLLYKQYNTGRRRQWQGAQQFRDLVDRDLSEHHASTANTARE